MPKAPSELGRSGAQARRIEIEHGLVEHEARDRRAGCRIAVGVEGAAVERQVGRVAQPDRRGDDMHVARRGHHGVAGERLVGCALNSEHRRKHGKQQAGKRSKNEGGKARNDVLSSHEVDFARLDDLACSLLPTPLPRRGKRPLPAAVKACGPSLLLQTVADERKLDCNAQVHASDSNSAPPRLS